MEPHDVKLRLLRCRGDRPGGFVREDRAAPVVRTSSIFRPRGRLTTA
jgi:hypothetical protein